MSLTSKEFLMKPIKEIRYALAMAVPDSLLSILTAFPRTHLRVDFDMEDDTLTFTEQVITVDGRFLSGGCWEYNFKERDWYRFYN